VRRYLEWVVGKRWIVIALTVLVTAVLATQIKHLKMIIDPNNFLPPSHPYVVTTHKVENTFGSKYVVVIGITPKSGDAFQPLVLEKIHKITTALRDTPGVVKENLLSLAARRAKDIRGTAEGMEVRPLMQTVPKTPEKLAALKTAVERNPAYLNSIVSKDFKTAAVLAEFREGPGGFRGMIERVDKIVDPLREEAVDIAIGGLPSFLTRIETYSERIAILFPLAVLLVGLIHYEAFRTIQGLILPLVTALLAVIWGVGLMSSVGVPMDVFNATTPILILAVAAGHAVQLLKRYYEEYHRLRETSDLAPKEANRLAVIESLSRVGPVMLTAGSIAALGFFSLVVFEMSAVRTFGVFTGLGILSALVIEMTFIPALRSMLPAPGEKERRAEREDRFWSRFTNAIADLVTGPHRAKLFIGVGVLIAIAAVGASRVVVDSATKSFFAERLPFKIDDNTLNARLGGTNTLYLLIEGGEEDAIKDPAVLKAMDATQRFLERYPNVGKTLSMTDFVKRMNQAMNGDDPAFHKIPDSRELISQYLLLYSMSGEPGDFDSYVDYGYKSANVIVFLKSDSSAELQQMATELKAFAAHNFPPNVKVGIGGSVPQGTAITEVLVKSKILNIVQIGAVVFLISSLVFRSIFAGFLVLLPLLMAVLVNFGIMGWSGMRMNIPNSLSSAIAVGIGADYAIYMLYRLREEIAQGLSEDAAVRHVLATAGKACLFVASAVAGGYGVLWFSPGFYVHTWLATLIACAMLTSALAALTLVPALVLVFKPRFIYNGGAAMKLKPATATLAGFALLTLLTAAPHRAEAEGLTAEQIADKTFMASKFVDSVSDATFRLMNKSGQERVRKTFGTTKLQANGVDNMRMTRFLSPPDVKGTVTLLIEHADKDDDIWIYLPALKKVRRLVASNKKDSFVGTDFTYGDVIGHKPGDWKHKIVKEETLDNRSVWVVESLPKNDDILSNSGYSKRINWIDKESFLPLKSEFYDDAGELLKTSTFSDIKLMDKERNRWQAMKLEAQNVQTGHKTIIQFENLKVNQGVQDNYFTTRYMERDS
jgi:uncharacterized protein